MDPQAVILAEKMFSVIGVFLLSIMAVAFMRDRGFLKENYKEYLNFAVIYITLPVLVFTVIKRSQLDVSMLGITASALAVTLIMLTVSLALISVLNTNKDTTGGFVLAATLGNTAYFGYPAVLAVFGDNKLINAVFYDYAIFIFIYTGGIFIAQTYGTKVSGQKFSSALVGILRFPAFLAFIPALALKNVTFPAGLTALLEAIGMATVPLVLLSIGLSFKVRSFASYKGLIALVAVFKLIVSPFIAFAIGSLLGLRSDMLAISVVQAGMPTAMMTVILGSKYGLDVDFLTNTVFITTALSILTLPLIMLILF